MNGANSLLLHRMNRSLVLKHSNWAEPRRQKHTVHGPGRSRPHITFLLTNALSIPRRCSASYGRCSKTMYARSTTALHAGSSSSSSSSSSTMWQSMLKHPPVWPPFLGTLALSGAVMGTLLDGIHSRVGLQVYDIAPMTVGPLHTSLLVPPLLATFYVVLGLLTCIADNLVPGPATAAAQQRACQDIPKYLAPCTAVLAANLACSAVLFDAQTPPSQIFLVLAVLAAVNWGAFDRTSQGLGLAVLCGLGAPASELVLMALTGCWHYSRPDVAGVFMSWVPLCYAFYVPAVSNLARYLWGRACRPRV